MPWWDSTRIALWAAVLAATAVSGFARAAPPAGKVDYNFQVRPLLADRCFVCHGPDEKKRKAKLRLDVPEVAFARRAIVPGKPDESIVVYRLESTEPGVMMPELPRRLVPDEAVVLIKEWIAQMKAPVKQASTK